MAEQQFNPERIIELAEELRLAGFDIGTQQYIAAQDLLIALAAHNRLPADPREWRSLLSPIFCASPAEQEEFYGRFNSWLDRHPEWTPKPDDLPEPYRREISIPAIHWLRKPVGIASVVLLILLTGFAVFLSLKTDRTLTGQVFSSDGDNVNPLPEAQVEFFNQPATKTDRDGHFTINYQARNWNRIFNRQVADLTVTHGEHEPLPPIKLDVHNPTHQTVRLQKRQPKPPDQTTITLPPTPEATPPPIPLLPEFTTEKPAPATTQNPIRWVHWLLIALPLILFALWLLLRWRRRRALLQKLQAAGSPNLRRLTVRGASEHLFQSPIFRRAVQDLRRHRRVETREIDIPSTVSATIGRGGMFQPRYGARKALPEYLLLIDRASPNDEQARFADELSQRLEAGGVFVDRFYFQNDPRTCRQREAGSPMVTLLDLAARYPDHQLLIFSDGAGFISPLTGEAEHWLSGFSHWQRRVLLTPELDEQTGFGELALVENDFLVLPANDDGFHALTEAVNAGELPNSKSKPAGNANANPFPRLILERPKRWLERHEPRPAVLKELCEQLKAYLGEDGWYWLAACAVYPALSWDVTLYLGCKLDRVGSPTVDRVSSPTVKEGLVSDGRATDTVFEDRLLRLIRLPWFRYGSMPDWLRLRLIESFSPEREREVRRTIETMLLSALEHPQEGIPLDIAERQPTADGWLQRMKARWNEWRRQRRIRDFIEKQIKKDEDSPLNDFVFLGFLSGNRVRRLTVKLPELLNRALFPQGQAALGFRPASVAVLAILLSATGAAYVVKRSQQVTNTPPTISPFYQHWDQAEQRRFIVEKAMQVLSGIANDVAKPSSEDETEPIRQKVSEYAARVGNGSTDDKFLSPGQNFLPEDLRYVFGRGVRYTPEIATAFKQRKVPELIGLYLAMAESEFRLCPNGGANRQGMFLLSSSRLKSVGIKPPQACKLQEEANAAAEYLASKPIKSVFDLLGIAELYNQEPGQAEVDELFSSFVAAAIVGENPRSFGLNMEPLSRYAQAALVSPSPSPSVTPTSTPRTVSCLTEKDLQGQYLIHSILARDANGQTTDIGEQYPLGPTYIGKPYSDAAARKIPGEAGAILDAEKISMESIKTCTTPVSPNECRKSNMGARCVDVILTNGTSPNQSGPQQTIPQAFTVTETPLGYAVNLGENVPALELVKIRAGEFTMGSNNGNNDEKPPHPVQVSAFSIGKYEVTQAQWQAVMGNNPSFFKGSNLPVESVTWQQANDFCARLSQATGYNFQLPTEAEWEYAARAGTQTEYSFGDDLKLLGDYAWYSQNSGNKTHSVGGKSANPWHLYDMYGNVYEWCSDRYDENYYAQLSKQGVVANPQGSARGQYRVVRGGSWGGMYDLRSAYRYRVVPGGIVTDVGFRVVLFARAP